MWFLPRPGLFSVKMGGSSLQRPETKGTPLLVTRVSFSKTGKPRARVTPPLLSGHPVHGTGPGRRAAAPTQMRRPLHPSVSRPPTPIFLWSFSFLY